ncbi:MAG: type IV pilus secretin PilQ [Francisellaceae bacterium]|nr:type IV pilus secretin PilQ [Francisellaceae bacterium]
MRDFGTPIKKMSFKRIGKNVSMSVSTDGSNENISYQVDNEYTLAVKPKNSSGGGGQKEQQFKYNGEKVSLSVVDADTKGLVEKLAQFTGMNVILSDGIDGTTTLSLKDVPWDQAFDLILKTNGLAKREMGNILQIAPTEVIQAREQIQLENEKSKMQLETLYSEFIKINYAEARSLADLIKSSNSSLLSDRGQVSVDERTNTLLIKETEKQLGEIKKMIYVLDIPVKQVMIEAQIVETTDKNGGVFSAAINGALSTRLGKYPLGIGSTGLKASAIAEGTSTKLVERGPFFDAIKDLTLPASVDFKGDSGFGFSLARLPGGTILDLELKALEAESKASVSSRPKLLTQDNQTATIESGQEFVTTQVAQDGATPTQTYKEAVLKLEVTPKITPDNKISMEMDIHNDKLAAGSSSTIDTTKLKTHALVDNGETVVIGGIYKLETARISQKVPFLGDIPILGAMFRSKSNNKIKTEIIIFITPRIVNNRLTT